MSLATIEQLIARQPSVAEDPRAQAMLDDASAAVRSYTGQTFDAVTADVSRVKLSRGTARLPQRPVTAVTAVTTLAGTAVSYDWDGYERVVVDPQLLSRPTQIGDPPMVVLITNDHGYEPEAMPEDIVAVVCQIAARSLTGNPQDARLTGRSVDDYSETYGTIGAAGPFGLFPDEARLLDRYRRDVGVVWI